jgi:hypothetical protein
MKTFNLAVVTVLGLSLGVANAAAPITIGNHSTAWSSGENFSAGGGG